MSDSNNRSNGNNRSDGNNWSDGNNYSNGNNCSLFLLECRGTHKSILCKGLRGIAYKVLNQQLTKEQSKDFYEKLTGLLNGWLPYVTNYRELKEKGWHAKYDEKNEYVNEKIKDDEEPYTKQYHHAWSSCPKKNELIALIKSCEYLNVTEALKVFTEITGIKMDEPEETIVVNGRTYKLV